MILEHIVRFVRSIPAPVLEWRDHRKAEIALDSSTGEFKWYSNLDGAAQTAVDLAHTQTISGSKTLSGTTSLSGTVAFTGATTGVRRAATITTTAEVTVTAAQSGMVFVATADTGTQVFTLPAAATPGLEYTFSCGHASGEIRVAVGTAGDNIIGKTHGAENATGISTTATTGLLLNTAANNVVGDFCTLVSDGGTSYRMVAVAGVWSAA